MELILNYSFWDGKKNSGFRKMRDILAHNLCLINTCALCLNPYTASVQHNHWPRCKLQVNSAKKRQWGKLNKTLIFPAWQVMFWTKFNLTKCLTAWYRVSGSASLASQL